MAAVVALGIMSGTSCDGVDAVLLELRSVRARHTPRVLGHAHRRFPATLRERLLRPDALRVQDIAELSFLLPEIYAKAAQAADPDGRAHVCAMHGQTVWHAPPPAKVPCTLQIGSTALLAQRLGVPVVGDLRGADVACGGQGAPIVPFAHWFFTPAKEAPRLVVNFGGICNVTYVGRRVEDVLAYDVGPGMMLSDAFAARATEGRLAFDRDGELSSRGRVLPELVNQILEHPFVRRRAPKSTGREAFGRDYFLPLFDRYSRARPSDVARSLLAGTAAVLERTVRGEHALRAPPREVLLSGGGARNPVLVAEVRARMSDVKVRVVRDGVFAPELHEPAAMALIAARTWSGLPCSLPRVTGARLACVLGHVHMPTRA